MNESSAFRRAGVVLLLGVSSVVCACSASTGGSAGPASSTTVGSTLAPTKGAPKGGQGVASGDAAMPDSHVKLADDVVVVRNVTDKTIKGLGNDGASLLLDGDDSSVKKLKVGSVLLLTGVGAGRVTQIDDVDGDLAVSYQSVTLSEVVQDGTFNWDGSKLDPAKGRLVVSPEMAPASGSSVEATPPKVAGSSGDREQGARLLPAPFLPPTGDARIDVGGRRSSRQAVADSVEGSAGKFKFAFEWTPAGDGGGDAKLDLTPSSDFEGKIGVDVHFDPISFGGGTKVKKGKVDFFDLDFKHLSGKATITGDLSALKQTASITTLPFLKIPASISFPFPILGIPFTVTLSATIQVNVAIALAQNSLHAEAKVDFGGPAGFSYKGGSVKLTGARTASTTDLLSKMKGVANGPVGMVFTTELPKVSFGFRILQTGAGVFVSNGMATSFWIAQAPVFCRRTQVASVVAGGIDASFLGFDVTYTRKPFLDKRWASYLPKNDKRCDDIGN